MARMLGGAAFALAQMAPRRYERLADAGAATGVIDPLLVRAYLRAGMALPGAPAGRRNSAQRRGPAPVRDRSGAASGQGGRGEPVSFADARVPDRSGARSVWARCWRWSTGWWNCGWRRRRAARAAAAGIGRALRGTRRMSAAMKLVVNSAYGYLAAGGDLTRFADVHAANEVTRRGRETLELMCREFCRARRDAARGRYRRRLLRGARGMGARRTSGAWWRRSPRCCLRWCNWSSKAVMPAMLSHEPKNYALLGYDGSLVLRGVAFRSSRAEPFGERFLRQAIARLLAGDVAGVREAYVATLDALRRRELPAYDVSSSVRLTKSPAEYLAMRGTRRELSYEAMLASGRKSWSVGDRIRAYRKRSGAAA